MTQQMSAGEIVAELRDGMTIGVGGWAASAETRWR